MTSNQFKKMACSALPVAVALVTATGAPAKADWKNVSDGIQHIYQGGVPHTDRNGNPLAKYDPAHSFFPLSIYHAFEGQDAGINYRYADLVKAGYNCAFTYPAVNQPTALKQAEAAGLQLMLWNPKEEDVKSNLNSPALLGYCMDDEPIGHYGNGLEKRFADIVARRDAIRTIDKTHPVMLVDSAWIQPPVTAWWIKINTAFDVSSHDNYPMDSKNRSLSHQQGIPESVSLAVGANKEQKPLWFVAQNFEQPGSRFNFTFPTVTQQRSMAYTSIIHGATGIVQFSLDSYITREANVIGIAPNSQPKHQIGVVATKDQLRQSRNLWDATIELNGELTQLRPALLSPTANVPYEIAIDDKWQTVTPNPIRTLLKTTPAGGYVLLMANIDDAPTRARIRFPEKNYKLTELFNPADAGLFKRDGDAFEFLSAPYDVRVFQIDIQ
jgi:hypothetical protein